MPIFIIAIKIVLGLCIFWGGLSSIGIIIRYAREREYDFDTNCMAFILLLVGFGGTFIMYHR